MVEAARILDVTPSTVHRWISDGVLQRDRPHRRAGVDRDQVEALAARRWPLGKGTRLEADSYWVTAPAAARILGVSRSRVGQLVDTGRLPYVRAARGVRLFRREQLEVIANARLSRRLSRPTPAIHS